MDTSKPRRPDVLETELVGGVEKRQLELTTYDYRWPRMYLFHKRRIGNALSAAEVDIGHIGSTSVPGLAAKPIIDIVVAVADITAEEEYLDALLATGYQLRVREPGHRLVRTPERDVQVHILQKGDSAIRDYILLRDHLRTSVDDRALYEDTKRDLLVHPWDDMNAYAEAKSQVIAAIMARARRHQSQSP
ncbi:GrpB family protein [Pseudarthrobacter sp. SL88]|uniref:GrpB family protein n=1 Tax=Pseudarthrobacter sp. SL88 TaxID=2994666 RepID=UPI0022732C5F|nr:GrpB family protein [Pseudarthrobacter sp. SL88]MCY1673474.1 GrpB family protein [Pseudarthrobacter sp. SL88]